MPYYNHIQCLHMWAPSWRFADFLISWISSIPFHYDISYPLSVTTKNFCFIEVQAGIDLIRDKPCTFIISYSTPQWNQIIMNVLYQLKYFLIQFLHKNSSQPMKIWREMSSPRVLRGVFIVVGEWSSVQPFLLYVLKGNARFTSKIISKNYGY